MYVKMPLMCFFLPLLESPSAPYNHKASSYPRSLAANLLINNFMGKRRNTRSSWCLPDNQVKESIKLHWWPTASWSLCLSFLLCVWNVVVLTLSPQPGVPLAPSWALFAALKSRTCHLFIHFEPSQGFEPRKKNTGFCPMSDFVGWCFFYSISELSKQLRTQNLTQGLFLPQKMFTIDAEVFLYHITMW